MQDKRRWILLFGREERKMIEKGWIGHTRTFTPTCDLCGEQLWTEYSWDDAIEAKKAAGWKSKCIDGSWMDICTDCQSKGEK